MKPIVIKRDLLKIIDVYNQRYDINNEIFRTECCIKKISDHYIKQIIKDISYSGYPITICTHSGELVNLENGFKYYL